MESDASASSVIPRDDFEMSTYVEQYFPSTHPSTSTALAPQSLLHESQISDCAYSTQDQDDVPLPLHDGYLVFGRNLPENAPTSANLLESQYPGPAMSDNPPESLSLKAFKSIQDTVPSSRLMSNPDQGAAPMGTNVSMPPPALQNFSPPVVELEFEALRCTRRSEKEWLSNRENIKRLIMDENCTLKATMETMKDVYGFSAS